MQNRDIRANGLNQQHDDNSSSEGVEGITQLLVLYSDLHAVIQVSWIRKRDLHILTSMAVTYTSDARFTIVGNPETDYWNLQIDYVQPRDAGIYECQVNTEPKIYRAVTLKVLGEFLWSMKHEEKCFPSAPLSLSLSL